jgi:hypothetical protein
MRGFLKYFYMFIITIFVSSGVSLAQNATSDTLKAIAQEATRIGNGFEFQINSEKFGLLTFEFKGSKNAPHSCKTHCAR